mmetsp:Transcript_53921/g.128437  ORF Transcript_53921/g.128437 Transcript_53921/m.128437 type:complete len:421 (-) Transcript_53921:151-1413(-)
MLQRAKEPAKLHSFERGGPVPVKEEPPRFLEAGVQCEGEGVSKPTKVEAVKADKTAHPSQLNSAVAAARSRPEERHLQQGRGDRHGRNAAGGPTKASEGRRPREAPASVASEPPPRQTPANEKASGSRVPESQSEGGAPQQPPSEAVSHSAGRHAHGKVPAYLRRRQKEMAEEKRLASLPPEPAPPEGCRRMPDQERLCTLDVLSQRKAEVEKDIERLPFKIETIGQKRREKELSDKLQQLNKLQNMLSKPVVFIPAEVTSLVELPTRAPAPAPQQPPKAGKAEACVAAEGKAAATPSQEKAVPANNGSDRAPRAAAKPAAEASKKEAAVSVSSEAAPPAGSKVDSGTQAAEAQPSRGDGVKEVRKPARPQGGCSYGLSSRPEYVPGQAPIAGRVTSCAQAAMLHDHRHPPGGKSQILFS